MRLRPVLLILHRWLGLVLGLLLAVITLSGAASVGIADVERWVGLRAVPGVVAEGAAQAPFAACTAAIAAAIPGAVADNYFPAEAPGRPDRVETVLRHGDAKEEFVAFCDPLSGEVIGDTRGSALVAALHWVAKAHGSLFLPGAVGNAVLGGAALLLLLFAASGLWLWLTMAPTAKAAGGRPFVVHRVVAALALPVLVASACTGALLAWQWSRPLAYRALGGDAAGLPYFAMTDEHRATFRGSGDGTPLAIDALVAAARAQPAAADCGAVLRITSLASKSAKPVKIAFDYPGNGDHRAGGVVLQMDRISGQVALLDDPRGHAVGGWLLARHWALHAGRWGSSAQPWGIAARWLWMLSGAGVTMLAVTGVLQWRRRRVTAG